MGRHFMSVILGTLLLALGLLLQTARAEVFSSQDYRKIQAGKAQLSAKTPVKVQRYIIPYKMHRKYLYHNQPSTVQAVPLLNPRIQSLPGSGHDYLQSYMNNR